MLKTLTAYGPLASGAWPALEDLLRDGSADDIPAAITAAAAIGDPPAEFIAELTRIAAMGKLTVAGARAARELGTKARPVADALIKRLADPDRTSERSDLVQTLGNLGVVSPDSVSTVATMLREVNGFDASNVLSALNAFGPEGKAAVPEIIAAADRFLKDSFSENAAQGAINLLGTYGPGGTDAQPLLIKLLDHNNPITRAAAAFALGRINPKATPDLPKLIAASLDADDKRTSPELTPEAVDALARLGPEHARPAVPVVARAMRKAPPNPYFRMKTAEALGHLGPAAVPHLTTALDGESDELIVSEIADALGRIGAGAAAAVPDLLELRFHRSPGTRRSAARALGQIGPAAIAAVPILLADMAALPSIDRAEFAAALLRIDPKRANDVKVALSADLRSDQPFVRAMALAALLRGGKPLADDLWTAVNAIAKDPDQNLRFATVFVLSQVAATEDKARLSRAFADDKDPTVRTAIRRLTRGKDREGKD